MTGNSDAWKLQLRRIAEQLKNVDEFALRLYRDEVKTSDIDYQPDFETIAHVFSSTHISYTDKGTYCFYVPSHTTSHNDRSWSKQKVSEILEAAGAALEIVPDDLRLLFTAESLNLSRFSRWWACLFDIALECRPGITLNSNRIPAEDDRGVRIKGRWHATIKRAVFSSIELIDLLLNGFLTAKEITSDRTKGGVFSNLMAPVIERKGNALELGEFGDETVQTVEKAIFLAGALNNLYALADSEADLNPSNTVQNPREGQIDYLTELSRHNLSDCLTNFYNGLNELDRFLCGRRHITFISALYPDGIEFQNQTDIKQHIMVPESWTG